jgi:replication-associated recombination protein RarA
MNIAQKYEPKRFSELVFSDPISEAVCHRYSFTKPHKRLMLWGPPGSAKTTTARVITRERFLSSGYDGALEEFNGATSTSKDFETWLNIASWMQMNGEDPIIIINELDEMDWGEQAKLRAWMDKWTWINLVVTTNANPHVQERRGEIIPALCSRFELIQIARPSLQDWLPRASMIFAAEGHPQTAADLQQLLSTFSGDVRGMLPIIEEVLDGLKTNPVPVVLPKPLLHVVPGSGKP